MRRPPPLDQALQGIAIVPAVTLCFTGTLTGLPNRGACGIPTTGTNGNETRERFGQIVGFRSQNVNTSQ